MSDQRFDARPEARKKAVLISGGARGIGRCLARTFLQRGHSVFILDIDEEELQYAASKHLPEHGGADVESRLGSAICNLSDIASIQKTVKQAADFFGGTIDVLIHNGGIASPYWKDGKSMDDPSVLEQWQSYMNVNLTAPFAVSSTAIPYMKGSNETAAKDSNNAGPCIILMGSFRALQSDPNQEGYASSKAGQIGLMHSMAVTCQQWGIRVNLVAPGRIKVEHECRAGDEKGTNFEETLTEDDTTKHLSNRAGRPMDIYRAVEYLVESGFVTGQDITVDGGVTRKKS